LDTFHRLLLDARTAIRRSATSSSTYDNINAIVTAVDYQTFLSKRTTGEKLIAKQAGIEALLAQARKFDASSFAFGAKPTDNGDNDETASAAAAATSSTNNEDPAVRLIKFVQWYRRTSVAEERAAEGKKQRTQHVSLTTIHQAKGLEWPLVVC
jgi:superfamily I DNA/RNA helicase